MGRLLRLGIRGSLLARRQAELVRDALLAREPDLAVQLEIIATQGDRAPDVPLQQMSGQGVFARAIEEALLAGQIDCAVHSLKDLPAAERAGLELVAFPRRADDAATRALLAPLDDAATRAAVVAERALLAALGGGCRVPIAAYGEVRGAELCLEAVVASPDGRTLLRDRLTAPPTAAPVLGMALAARLLAAGARDLLRERPAPA